MRRPACPPRQDAATRRNPPMAVRPGRTMVRPHPRRQRSSNQPRDFRETLWRQSHSMLRDISRRVSRPRRHETSLERANAQLSAAQRADRGKARQASPWQPPSRPGANPPQRHRRCRQPPRQRGPAQRPERRRAGMAFRRKGRGDEAKVRTQPPRPRQCRPPMHRHRQQCPRRPGAPRQQEGQQATRRDPVRQVQPGPRRQRGPPVPAHQQHQAPRPRQPRQAPQHAALRPPRQHALAAWQKGRRRPGIGQPCRVGQQPQPRQPPSPRDRRLEAPRPDL